MVAGPGWVVFGALKQCIGLFLAVYLIGNVVDGSSFANEPVHQFLGAYDQMMPAWLAMTLSVVLVVLSQVKINVTNAYSGSLAWTNSFTRLTKHYPGRLVFVVVNVLIALVLMEANMFSFLNNILGFYANMGIAWITTVATDIAVNKYLLGLSPKVPEFRRGMLYAINPVGFGSVVIAGGASIIAFFGGMGSSLQPYSPVIAVVLSIILPPVLDEHGNPSAAEIDCLVCEQTYERPDMLASVTGEGSICSLCLATDRVGTHVLPPSRAEAVALERM